MRWEPTSYSMKFESPAAPTFYVSAIGGGVWRWRVTCSLATRVETSGEAADLEAAKKACVDSMRQISAEKDADAKRARDAVDLVARGATS